MTAVEANSLPEGEHLFGSDTEHDRRVRARLTELARERNSTLEEFLEQLNAALAAGKALPLPPAEEADFMSRDVCAPGERPAIIYTRPADDVWGVVSAERPDSSIASDAKPAPCAGTERCPWRRDAATGTFPAEAFRLSARTSYPGSDRHFVCHSSTPGAPSICAGWMLRGAAGNAEAQELLRAGRLHMPVLPEGVELYDDYAQMAIANGVDPADPALAPLHGSAEQDEFVSLIEICASQELPEPQAP
ncbi:DUF6283 family protein [Streptomyces botrytidirepellens]|uniref:Uncharacterized protein n=1 Tax=Streptomyces botrytidirepellens TaxID=2486417 RepID=A0A3M8X7D8_9ACTN|nr:DUF6283 family protein [Streptomyces botrytidirepellens]RNG38037.1 hypothetical protein EEJ42_01985 [Streptomyces botrytidirepellens]